jgi:hypothetical protein
MHKTLSLLSAKTFKFGVAVRFENSIRSVKRINFVYLKPNQSLFSIRNFYSSNILLQQQQKPNQSPKRDEEDEESVEEEEEEEEAVEGRLLSAL